MRNWSLIARIGRAGIVVLASVLLGSCTADDGANVRNVGEGSGSGSASGSGSGSGSGSATVTSPDRAEDHSADAPVSVRVLAKDFHFELSPPRAAGSTFRFHVTNDGRDLHEFEVIGPAGGAIGEIEPFPSGGRRELVLDLAEGTYHVQCLVERGSLTHAELGMRTTFEVD